MPLVGDLQIRAIVIDNVSTPRHNVPLKLKETHRALQGMKFELPTIQPPELNLGGIERAGNRAGLALGHALKRGPLEIASLL